MRQVDLDDFRAEFFVDFGGVADGGFDGGVDSVGKELRVDADLEPGQGVGEALGKVWHVFFGRSRIAWIVARDVIHCECTVFSSPSHRSDLVQATGKGDQAKSADSTVSRFQTSDAAKRSGLPDRTASITAECDRSQASGDRGRGSSAGASGDVLCVEGVE